MFCVNTSCHTLAFCTLPHRFCNSLPVSSATDTLRNLTPSGTPGIRSRLPCLGDVAARPPKEWSRTCRWHLRSWHPTPLPEGLQAGCRAQVPCCTNDYCRESQSHPRFQPEAPHKDPSTRNRTPNTRKMFHDAALVAGSFPRLHRSSYAKAAHTTGGTHSAARGAASGDHQRRGKRNTHTHTHTPHKNVICFFFVPAAVVTARFRCS
jgi:hypothetical protein